MATVSIRTIQQNQLPKNAEIRNDMIDDIQICRNRGFILGATVNMKSGRQPLFNGYNNTSNIGYVILALAEVLGVNTDGECADILAAFKGTPCRIASIMKPGDRIAQNSWIGHFMFDKWILASDVILAGITKE